jgi:hypothetical protein
MGYAYNVLILLYQLLTCLCSLFIVIPSKNYELQFCLNVIRIILIYCFTFSYLCKYVGGIWTSPMIILASIFFVISQLLRYMEVINEGSIVNKIHLASLALLVISSIIYIFFIFQWLHSIRHIKFENYTLVIYSSNVYIILLFIYGSSLWLASIVYGSPIWYNCPTALLIIYNYIMFTFVIGVTMLQNSAATIDIAISLSKV